MFLLVREAHAILEGNLGYQENESNDLLSDGTIFSNKFLFLDKTGSNLQSRSTYGYSSINVLCSSYVPANIGRNKLLIINK